MHLSTMLSSSQPWLFPTPGKLWKAGLCLLVRSPWNTRHLKNTAILSVNFPSQALHIREKMEGQLCPQQGGCWRICSAKSTSLRGLAHWEALPQGYPTLPACSVRQALCYMVSCWFLSSRGKAALLAQQRWQGSEGQAHILCRTGTKEKCGEDKELAHTTHTEWPVEVAQHVSTEGRYLDFSVSTEQVGVLLLSPVWASHYNKGTEVKEHVHQRTMTLAKGL